MPASTCWQCLAATRALRPARGLGHRGGDRRGVEPGGVEHRDRGLDRDQRLGQSVADRLELGDRLVELDALQARARAPAPARWRDTPTSSCASASCASCTAALQSTGVGIGRRDLAVHLDQPEVGVDAVHRARARRAIRRRRLVADATEVRGARRRREAAHRRRPAPARRSRADRRAAPPRCRRRARDPSANATTRSSADDRAHASPWSSNNVDTAARCRTTARRPSPSSATAASSASPVCCSVAARRLRSNSSRSSPSITRPLIGRSRGRGAGGR